MTLSPYIPSATRMPSGKHRLKVSFIDLSISAKLRDIFSFDLLSFRRDNAERFMQFWSFVSAFCGTIHHIVGLSSKKEVGWSNATVIVTFVANKQRLIKGTVSQFISHSVGHKTSSWAVGTMTKNPVSISIFDAFPFPALAGFINFFPKSFFDRFVACHGRIITMGAL